MPESINVVLKSIALTTAVAGLLAGCGGGTGSANSPETEPFYPAAEDEWEMVWNDEFDGDSLDLSNWDIQLGDGSDAPGSTDVGLVRWGNNEQQWYLAENATVGDGMLTITAGSDASRPGFPYTSARIRTSGKFSFKYGRAEARIRSASGQGLWSAFWMLPEDSPYGGWASSGEVDIMEVVNADTPAEQVFGSLHHGFPWPLNRLATTTVDGVNPADDFNVYAIEWSEEYIRWYINDQHYKTVNADHWYAYYYANRATGYEAGAGAAPFDTAFHLLLNLAVGGNLPGTVDDAAIPAEMVVDYVRVYQCSAGPDNGVGCNVNADRTLEAPERQSAFEDSFNIYVDGATPLEWVIQGETVLRELAVNSFWRGPDNALVFDPAVAVDGRGTVLEVQTSNSGNISINAVDGEPTTLFGMGNNPSWWMLHAAELKFDIRVMRDGTDPDSSLLIKMDSGWPALGTYDLAVSSLPADEWTTVSVPINDLIAYRSGFEQPIDTSAIVSFFVLEPTSSAHVQVDNIQIACGHPERNGCGIRPPGGEVDGELVPVFINEVGPAWTNGIGAWDVAAGGDYYEGNTANLVTWNVVDSGDPERGNILQVNFGSNADNGVFYIQSASAVDLSSFASEGKLIFDLKLQAGSTHGMTFKIDCFFPCSSGDRALDLSNHTRGEWNTHEVAIADLAPPLDLANVNTGIVIFPTIGEHYNVSYELDNIRWEVQAGEPDPGAAVTGTWQLAPQAGALRVGPEPGSGGWWMNNEADVDLRACLFDDQYIFLSDGSFRNVLGDATWLEGWQGASDDGCGAPVAPHDGSADGAWAYDADAGSLTLTGRGAYLGLPKVFNGGELANPASAVDSITYNVSFDDDGNLVAGIPIADPGHWTFVHTRVGDAPAPPARLNGVWRLAPEANALEVGPADGGIWWASSAADVDTRSCLFDDEYVFLNDGTFRNAVGDETWLETWQGAPEGCGTPVAPHDGSADGAWEHDADAGTLRLIGAGSYLGIAKVINNAELTSPADAPGSIDYEITFDEDDPNRITVVVGILTSDGTPARWTFRMVKTGAAPAA